MSESSKELKNIYVSWSPLRSTELGGVEIGISITAPKTEPAAAPKPTTTEVSKPQPTPSITTPKTEPADRVVITADEFLSGATPQDKPVTTTEPKEVPSEKEEVKVDPWEGLRNYIGKCDSIIAELKEIGFTSYDDLSFFLSIGVHEKYPPLRHL